MRYAEDWHPCGNRTNIWSLQDLWLDSYASAEAQVAAVADDVAYNRPRSAMTVCAPVCSVEADLMEPSGDLAPPSRRGGPALPPPRCDIGGGNEARAAGLHALMVEDVIAEWPRARLRTSAWPRRSAQDIRDHASGRDHQVRRSRFSRISRRSSRSCSRGCTVPRASLSNGSFVYQPSSIDHVPAFSERPRTAAAGMAGRMWAVPPTRQPSRAVVLDLCGGHDGPVGPILEHATGLIGFQSKHRARRVAD